MQSPSRIPDTDGVVSNDPRRDVTISDFSQSS